MNRIKALSIALVMGCLVMPYKTWADPNLTDQQNYQEGLKLHQQGKFKDAYEFYFKDMTQNPKTLEWLKNYREKYFGEVSLPVLPATMPVSEQVLPIQPSLGSGVNGEGAITSNVKAGESYRTADEQILYGDLGFSTPIAPSSFSTFWKSGFSVGGGYGIGISKITTVIFSFDYSSFTFDSNKFLASYGYSLSNIQISGGDAHSVVGLVNFKIKFSSHDPSVLAYFIGGLGMGSYGVSETTITDGYSVAVLPAESVIKPVLRLGLGLDIKLSPKVKLYFETNGFDVIESEGSNSYNVLKGGLIFRLN